MSSGEVVVELSESDLGDVPTNANADPIFLEEDTHCPIVTISANIFEDQCDDQELLLGPNHAETVSSCDEQYVGSVENPTSEVGTPGHSCNDGGVRVQSPALSFDSRLEENNVTRTIDVQMQTNEVPDLVRSPPPGSSSSSSSLSDTSGPRVTINNSIFEVCESGGSRCNTPRTPAPGPVTGSSDNPRLTNFFEFGSKSVPMIATRRKGTADVKLPPVKLPRIAHYKARLPEDEVKYVEELKTLHNVAIPARRQGELEVDSDEEAQDLSSSLPRVFRRKEAVFKTHDFKYRKFSTNHLAAHHQRDKIVSAIDKNRVLIVDGFTGCGKTTQVPQFIIDHAFETNRPCNVVVTQPRRLAAISVARRVCEERGWNVGSVVGYQVGMEKVAGPDTLVTFMTTGVLLQKLTRCRSLRQWSHIIIDEVHERDLYSDLLLLFIKKILIDDVDGHQSDVKLILMSATLDTKLFSQYFKTQRDVCEIDETPVVKIPSFQRKFQIEEIYLDELVPSSEELQEISANLDIERPAILPEIYQYAVRTILSMDDYEKSRKENETKESLRGSVLVFLPGLMEIKTLKKLLEDESKRPAENGWTGLNWDIVPLHSSITAEEQSLVFKPPEKFRRKIILSTNIAESSITVADIVYVMDFCLTKSNCVDSSTNFSSLRACWASVNQCIQRKGRAGRVQDGRVFRMLPRKFFSTFSKDAMPDMQKSALEQVVLQVKTLDMGSPQEMLCLALNPPEISGIERAVANLKEVGAMTVMTTVKYITEGRPMYTVKYDTCDGDVTFLGKLMATLPVSPQCSRLIMLGHCFGVLREALIIAAALSGKSPFSSPMDKQLNTYMRKLRWAKDAYSDCFAVLYAYMTWTYQFGTESHVPARRAAERYWCRDKFVQSSQMREIRNLVEELEERLKGFGIFVNSFAPEVNHIDSIEISKEAALMLKIAIAGAFYPNYFQPHRSYSNNCAYERSKEVSGNDVFSTVYYRNFPTGNNRGHNGNVYAKHISDELSNGLSVPYVKFDGQKVFAIFDGPGKKIGPIYEAVYRAIKKRQARHVLEFNLVGLQEEKAELTRFQQAQSRRRYIICPSQFALPSVAVKQIGICVTHVESPSQFWIINSRHTNKHAEITIDINTYPLINDVRENNVYVNELVLAPFKDETGNEMYYRAKILAFGHRTSLVFFIDYGNSRWVEIKCLRHLPPALMTEGKNYHTFVGLVVECRLSETKPAKVHGSIWTASAIQKFKEFVANMVTLRMEIYAVDNSVIIGEVLNNGGENINRILINENFADHGPEPYTATFNYKARCRYSIMMNDGDQEQMIKACNKEQVAKAIDRDFIPPPTYGRMNCRLRGPYSPMELDFQSLCQSSSAKQVTVDNHSVNSVVLDHEIDGPTSRLLVAATINIHEKSGGVVPRETTLMPSIPGMLSLMALVFAPRAELRLDPHMYRYTGALCGLGMNPENNEPVYMDHDLEVIFDVEIDDADIELINHIRNDLNQHVRENDAGCNPASLYGNLSKNFMRLLKRKRKRLEERIYPQESYVWGRISPENIIHASRQLFPVQPLDIFVPHDTVQLRTADRELMSWDFAI